MANAPRINAIKLTKDIWFLKAGQIYYYKDGSLWSHEPGQKPVRTMDSLAEAIMNHVEDDYPDPYIEVIETYNPPPPQYIKDFDGNKYKLVTPKDITSNVGGE